MPKLKINDISMYYEIHGEGEPVVFISGFGADHLSWRAVIESFKENYQVILLDNRGAGQTDAPTGPYAIDQMADDVVQLCSNLGIKQAHFVGNSMGGFILQTIAYLHPHLVKSATISHSSATIHTCFQIYLSAQLELLKANAPLPSLIKASLCWVFSYQFLSKPDMLNMLCELSLNNPYPFTIKGYEGQLVAVNQQNFSANRFQTQTIIASMNVAICR